jgi:hypothetical protein
MVCALAVGAVLLPPVTSAGEAGLAPSGKLESVLGREVRTTREGDGGRIIDVLADAEGNVRAVVIEFGGFLGIGTRKIAVEWQALRFSGEGGRAAVQVDVSRDQLRAAPEYRPQNEPAIVQREGG